MFEIIPLKTAAAPPRAAIETVETVRAARARDADACARHLDALRRLSAEGAVGDQRRRRALAARHPPPKTFTIDMRPSPGRAIAADPQTQGHRP